LRPAPGLFPPCPPVLFDFVGIFSPPSFITLLITLFIHT